MKKSVAGIAVLVLVAAGIVLPAGYFGRVAETTLKNRMANMPYGLQMELTDYRRGWFSSTARLVWNPPGGLPLSGVLPEGPLPDVAVMDLPPAVEMLASGPVAIDIEIAHGPVYFAVGPGVGLFNARGRVDFGDQASSDAEDSPDRYMELYVSSFSGATVDNRLEFPGANWDLGPMDVHLAGVLFEGEWTGPDSFQLQHVALENMEMKFGAAESGLRIAISDLVSRTEYPQGLNSGAILAPSEATSSAGEILVEQSGGDTVFRMTGLSSVDTTAPEEDGTYRAESDATIESMEVLGREFAPIEIRQTVGGLREESLMQLLAAFTEGSVVAPAMPQDAEQDLQGPDSAPPASPAPIVLPQPTPRMQAAILAILADGPYTDMNAVLAYQGEHAIRLDMHYSFDPGHDPATAEMVSLPSIISGLVYTVDAEIPIAAAEELFGQGMIQLGLMQGLLQQNESTYTASVALRNGTLSINGRPMPIALGPPAGPGAKPPG